LARASRNARTLVFTRLRFARFTSVRVSVWRARLSADTWFAMVFLQSPALNFKGKS
jgi:hypothetical protein